MFLANFWVAPCSFNGDFERKSGLLEFRISLCYWDVSIALLNYVGIKYLDGTLFCMANCKTGTYRQ